MLGFFVVLFVFYAAFKAYVSFLQIKFIKQESLKPAVVLEEAEYKNAAKIAIDNQKFELASLIFGTFVSIVWLVFGLRILFEATVKTASNTEYIVFVMSFLIINSLFDLPFNVYEKFIKDKKHGFSNVTAKIFIIDTIKSLALTLVFGSAFVWLLLFCLEALGELWWFWAFLISFGIILIINLIYPTVIAPIFNKVTPLEDGELKSNIENLLTSLGFKSSGVFVMDASKRDNRLNAYFGGLGATKRVVLFDTLIKKLSVDEIIAVLGHELGHFKHKDILKMIALSSLMLFCLFGVFGNINKGAYDALGMSGGGAVIVFLLLFSPIFSFIFSPFISYISRKNEFNADKFGAKTKDRQSMINALKKLGSQNKAFPLAHPLYATLYHSHPSLVERINELENED
ncbi:M48 family metallopeptidase [Campylobacter sp. RM9344]|uniref:M48 family metallopeptidase n=1 Tax=Campylobacter californiensis TaxID=1032243 RepID=A0AAW3ZS43_9BACT|nr:MULTISPECIES: M48 family metallopeptidase [unclassified Campylobacter]MBE2983842.1 M48 family metallopeptidase [Campylobacter sp. RM6883]MBE2985594.1 M48 family metallopeptidase [Campylobacter sp. RM12919]MBE2987377.1 M48 family metallopeptidase [Campylobacter sp. RM12920]MBE2994380.1 M48 family metallopeptidase [Campylobacter sp. RM6913]MBE3028688.1 M48 family metallopeptidase [Campylobacter sp. RM9344]